MVTVILIGALELAVALLCAAYCCRWGKRAEDQPQLPQYVDSRHQEKGLPHLLHDDRDQDFVSMCKAITVWDDEIVVDEEAQKQWHIGDWALVRAAETTAWLEGHVTSLSPLKVRPVVWPLERPSVEWPHVRSPDQQSAAEAEPTIQDQAEEVHELGEESRTVVPQVPTTEEGSIELVDTQLAAASTPVAPEQPAQRPVPSPRRTWVKRRGGASSDRPAGAGARGHGVQRPARGTKSVQSFGKGEGGQGTGLAPRKAAVKKKTSKMSQRSKLEKEGVAARPPSARPMSSTSVPL